MLGPRLAAGLQVVTPDPESEREAEAFTTYLGYDVLRVVITAGALLLLILVVRLSLAAWPRRHEPQYKTMWLSVSYALTMFAICGYRLGSIGTPPDSRLFVTTAIVFTGAIGMAVETESHYHDAVVRRLRRLRP